MKTGLKKLNMKGCAVSTRKQFAEDAQFIPSTNSLTDGYVKYAIDRDKMLMEMNGIELLPSSDPLKY
jgi:hypothetical protein